MLKKNIQSSVDLFNQYYLISSYQDIEILQSYLKQFYDKYRKVRPVRKKVEEKKSILWTPKRDIIRPITIVAPPEVAAFKPDWPEALALGTTYTAAIFLRCEDNAASTVVTNAGTAGNGVLISGTTAAIHTASGKINGAFTGLSATQYANNFGGWKATGGKLFISDWYKSDPLHYGGATWSDLGQQFSQTQIRSLANIGGGVVVAGTAPSGKILRSVDSGATWSDLGQQFSQTYIFSLANVGGGVVVAGTYPDGKILRSADYGAVICGQEHESIYVYTVAGYIVARLSTTDGIVYAVADGNYDGAYHHFAISYDRAAIGTWRLRIWHDGVEGTGAIGSNTDINVSSKPFGIGDTDAVGASFSGGNDLLWVSGDIPDSKAAAVVAALYNGGAGLDSASVTI